MATTSNRLPAPPPAVGRVLRSQLCLPTRCGFRGLTNRQGPQRLLADNRWGDILISCGDGEAPWDQG